MRRRFLATLGEFQKFVRKHSNRRQRPRDAPQPQPLLKSRRQLLRRKRSRRRDHVSDFSELPRDELSRLIRTLEEEMHEAATDLRFEYAARLRDEIADLKREMREVV